MTLELDIIKMAQEAGLTIRGHYDEPGSTPQELERFAALVAAAADDHGCTLAQRDALLEVLQDLCDTLGECSLTNKARAAIKAVEENT